MKVLIAGFVMVVAVLISEKTSAQIGTTAPIGNKFYFGGGLSFGGGTNSYAQRYSYFSVFPMVGYRFTPAFSGGTGITYQRYNYPDYGESYEQYGISPFLRYNINQLFFQTEYGLFNSPAYDYQGNLTNRQNYSRLLFGIGWSQPFSENGRGAINAMAMYDVLYRAPSVFNSPFVFRVFVTF